MTIRKLLHKHSPSFETMIHDLHVQELVDPASPMTSSLARCDIVGVALYSGFSKILMILTHLGIGMTITDLKICVSAS